MYNNTHVLDCITLCLWSSSILQKPSPQCVPVTLEIHVPLSRRAHAPRHVVWVLQQSSTTAETYQPQNKCATSSVAA